MFKLAVFILILGVVCAKSNKGIDYWFKYSEIVPDILDTSPYEAMKITFKNGEIVDLGTIFTPDQVEREPKISWSADPNALYTLTMLDPDAISKENPKYRSWRHWLVVDIPGSKVQKGNVISEYEGAEPPIGRHRYVVLAFKQQGRLGHIDVGEERASFNIRKFARKYRLGNPVAGNYFRSYHIDK